MKNNRFCFITCVNDEETYQECLYYINHLELPDGYEIETLAIRGARSIAEGYNRAIIQSDAKYKIYLHQDVFLVNRQLLSNLLAIFQADERVGMLGLVGTEELPPDGIWWNGVRNYGRVFDTSRGKIGLIAFDNPVDGGWKSVQAIDGIFMATQYDLPFRSDLFDGWHFYDVSQSLEFIRKGYRIAVPTVSEPWCIHDCGITPLGSGYQHDCQTFLKEYAGDFQRLR